ncbi:methyl-accepting chemotaxis protein [Megalodesulfovibrio paquesii]
MSRSIRTTLLILLGSLVLVVQGVLVYFVSTTTYSKSLADAQGQLEQVASALSRSASDFGVYQMQFVQGVARLPELRELLLGQGDEQHAADMLAGLSMASDAVNTLYLFNAQGTQVVTMAKGKAAKLSALADREYIQAALAGQPGYSSAPTKSIATGKLIVSVTAPIFDDAGKSVGGVGMSYVLDGLIKEYVEGVRIGNTGHPFILSPKGVMVAHPNAELLLKDVSQEPGMAAILASPQGRTEYTSEGTVRQAVWTRVPTWNWVLAFAMDMDEIEAAAISQRNFLLVLGGVAVLALIVVALLALDVIVVKPLKQLERFAAAVAGGQLNATLPLVRRNEIGKLGDSLRSMVQSLKDKIQDADDKQRQAQAESERAAAATREAEAARTAAERARVEGMLQAAGQLESIVEIVTTASEELAAQIEQSSQGAQDQSRRVTETATAMEEMTATVLEVARSASEAADSADKAKGRAEGGATVVDQVIHGIKDAQTQALSLKADMTALGKQAESIGQILNVISDIADQTNLLALNAAIEAARAGDAGRGFAVVADEVRKLAEKTMTATKEVGSAIRDIQNGTRKNVDNVERAVASIDSATSLAGQSGEALGSIVNLVETTSEQVRSIATAAEEQSATSEQINRSIEAINQISQETSDAMQQSANAVTELADQALKLKRVVERLKDAR